MTDKDSFDALLPRLHGLLWADRETRARMQSEGLNLIPANFYSNVPSIAEVEASFEYSEPTPPYLDPSIFDASSLRQELESLVEFSAEFSPDQDGDEQDADRYFWGNSQFSYSDAMSYYAYIRCTRPARIVEVGSGFSTLVAMEALQANGQGELVCIEPFPRPFIKALQKQGRIDLREVPVQDIAPTEFSSLFSQGDMLFIDSTHTVKAGSDCLHLYLRLLPAIRHAILVHVHDIFLPFGFPKHWMTDYHIYWTEQYLLMAFLLDNPRTRIRFGSAYHEHYNATLLAQFMHGRHQAGGSSLWFDLDGRP